jgi:very-short-patch-repair endonuclease
MLAQHGYRVFRVHNTDVYEKIGGVLVAILAELEPST